METDVTMHEARTRVSVQTMTRGMQAVSSQTEDSVHSGATVNSVPTCAPSSATSPVPLSHMCPCMTCQRTVRRKCGVALEDTEPPQPDLTRTGARR
jgi:hypothetical protein